MDVLLRAFPILATAPGESAPIVGWTAADLPLVLLLPVLLVASAFFSGSETALFGFTAAQRRAFRVAHPLAGRAVDRLLDDQRMLLITLLLGNMVANVLYFIIGSVLMMHANVGPIGETVLAIVTLLLIVVGGEVGPKILASAGRLRVAAFIAPLLLTIHTAIGPLRFVVAHFIVEPLSRLTAPSAPPPPLADDEIEGVLAAAGSSGAIEPIEQRMLQDIVALHRVRVAAVMTPRVRMVGVPTTATRAEVLEVTRASRLTRLPVYRGDLDAIVGMLDVRRYLLADEGTRVTDRTCMSAARFVPELATLEMLLLQFHQWNVPSAIVVDERGGTEGIVAVEDVVEEFVGDIVAPDEEPDAAPQLIGLATWTVRGDLPLHEFTAAFGAPRDRVRATTLAGLLAECLGHTPRKGDLVALEGLTIVVATAPRRDRALTATVHLHEVEEDGA